VEEVTKEKVSCDIGTWRDMLSNEVSPSKTADLG
jgi:hypothetical protein